MLPRFIIDNRKSEAEAFFLTAHTAVARGEDAREAAVDALAAILNFEGIGEEFDDAVLEEIASEAYDAHGSDIEAAVDFAAEEAMARR